MADHEKREMTTGYSFIEVIVDPEERSFSDLMEMNTRLKWVYEIMGERNWRQHLFQGVLLYRGTEKWGVATEESGFKKRFIF